MISFCLHIVFRNHYRYCPCIWYLRQASKNSVYGQLHVDAYVAGKLGLISAREKPHHRFVVLILITLTFDLLFTLSLTASLRYISRTSLRPVVQKQWYIILWNLEGQNDVYRSCNHPFIQTFLDRIEIRFHFWLNGRFSSICFRVSESQGCFRKE